MKNKKTKIQILKSKLEFLKKEGFIWKKSSILIG